MFWQVLYLEALPCRAISVCSTNCSLQERLPQEPELMWHLACRPHTAQQPCCGQRLRFFSGLRHACHRAAAARLFMAINAAWHVCRHLGRRFDYVIIGLTKLVQSSYAMIKEGQRALAA
ncbi:hypothetical protein CVIRNUC_003866 [Coccomyxa viridis]|uniref:Secreted protein n=1 Tax=Coccomyxa viridis TaxID=1274662 RepID=A0AAV1HZW2_9CHLO|nr:hypothetical protein CVIRNUC_003866 [Coccomyxa viridis]